MRRGAGGPLESVTDYRCYLETVTALARATEARDQYTGAHVARVRVHSRRIGLALGLRGASLRQLGVGAVLHDVGKIGLPDSVLCKKGPLTPADWVLVRRHPEIGRRMLAGISFLRESLDAVTHHHERWDGRGYPSGLAGEAIPLLGRIVAVADAYDAMTSDRSHRRALAAEDAFAEVAGGRGHAFDPAVVDAFVRGLSIAA